MANTQTRSQRLRVSGIAAHVRASAVEFPCQLEELSADGAFLRADRLVEIGSTLEVELAKPGARTPLRLRGIVLRAIPGRDGLGPGLDVEFRLVPNEDFQRLVAWIDEMRARAGHALSQLPGIAPEPEGEGERSKLMLQIKGLLMEMDDLRDRLRMRDIEIDDLRSQLTTAAQLLGRPRS